MSSELKEFLKQKKKEAHADSSSSSNEVDFLFISQQATPTRVLNPVLSSQHTITITCDENAQFILPHATAKRAKFIANIIEATDGVQYKEAQANMISLPQFKADVLEEIFRFCALDSLMNPHAEDHGDDSYTASHRPRVAFLFTLNPTNVIELVIAAHFLMIPPLVSIAIKYIAEYIDIEDVSVLQAVPPDVRAQIYANFTPKQLAHIEKTEGHKALDFDTSETWKQLCEKQGWIIIDTNGTEDWKTIFFEQLLRCTLIGWSEKSNILSIYDILETGGQFIKKLYVNRVEPPWEAYIHLLPNLVYFDIWEYALDNRQCEYLVSVLAKIPNFSSLTICDCGLNDERLEIIAPLLVSPTLRITKLDLSLNTISQEGTEKLALRLKSERPSACPPLTITLSFNNVNPGPRELRGAVQDIDFGENVKCVVSFDRTFLQKNHPHRY